MRRFKKGETVVYVGGGKTYIDNATYFTVGSEYTIRALDDEDSRLDEHDCEHRFYIDIDLDGQSGYAKRWMYSDNFIYPYELEPED